MDREYLENLVGAEAAEEILKCHRAALARQALSGAVKRLGGRNEKAIRAMLDENALLDSEDILSAAEEAVRQLKQENGWLFAAPQISSPGTGALRVERRPTMEDVANMSLAEYKRFRQNG